jgi:hypothetical protein
VDTYAARLVGYSDIGAPLQAAWAGAMWTRAAELLRSYATGPSPAPLWPPESAAAFTKMVTSIHVRFTAVACHITRATVHRTHHVQWS